VVGLGKAVVVVVSGAGLAVVGLSWKVCSKVVTGAVVVSWARAEVSRLVSCHPTHSMSGLEISRARISGFVAGPCHLTTGSLLLSSAYILSVMSSECQRRASGTPSRMRRDR
jgi:hypothetical protein